VDSEAPVVRSVEEDGDWTKRVEGEARASLSTLFFCYEPGLSAKTRTVSDIRNYRERLTSSRSANVIYARVCYS
jgi:hypothetical protein